jgi:hypothetical protein
MTPALRATGRALDLAARLLLALAHTAVAPARRDGDRSSLRTSSA